MDRDDAMPPETDCPDCALKDRRAFLASAAAALSALALTLHGTPALAEGFAVTTTRALRRRMNELTFPVPAADGAQIDRENEVIVVRSQQKAYVFNLSCPHQRTALRWQGDENQFQCPKHHSRYRPDGVFISGRATRGMDRFAVRRDGGNIVADLARLFRQDENATEWDAAAVTLS
jgi:nitrite reductase/ring-hydroxylating ferredoxin subunit